MLASVAVSSPGHVTNQQTLQVRRFVVCHVNVDEKKLSRRNKKILTNYTQHSHITY